LTKKKTGIECCMKALKSMCVNKKEGGRPGLLDNEGVKDFA